MCGGSRRANRDCETMNTDPHRRRAEDREQSDCCDPARKIGDDICDRVLTEICRANRRDAQITIWDLPRVTGLPLHEAFAAVRTLEFGRLLVIDDNLSDPFGATLKVREDAMRDIEIRRVA